MAYKWIKVNNNKLHEENPYDYITLNALEAIKNLEGHKKAENAKFKGRTTRTSVYGMTQVGLDGLNQLQFKFGVKLPDFLVEAKLDKLSSDELRIAAAYKAMLTTKLIDEITESNGFSRLPLEFRSGILAATHTSEVTGKSYKDSYKKKLPGSFLLACEEGNPYKIALSLISNSDGTLQNEYTGSGNDGAMKRNLAGVLLAFNPDMTWNSEEHKAWERDMKTKGFTAKLGEKLREQAVLDEQLKDADLIGAFKGDIGEYQEARKDNKGNEVKATPHPYNEIMKQPVEPLSVEQKSPEQSFFESFTTGIAGAFQNAYKSVFGPNRQQNNQVAQNEENILNNPNGEKV